MRTKYGSEQNRSGVRLEGSAMQRITAKFAAGVLEIHLPRLEPAEPQGTKIAIE
jgi:HSP20 family molecular chaperone IbpA